MKQPVFSVLLIIIVMLTSCSTRNSKQGFGFGEQSTSKSISDKSIDTSQDKKLNPTERKLIKDGNLKFETDHIETTQATVIKAVEAYGGYFASDETHNWEGRKSSTVIIRVPAKHFDQLINDITEGVDHFETKQIQVKDVTEEFVDVEARIKTQKELETRYLELLKKAKTVKEMLEIEQQIGSLRSEIESVEGRLQYLQSQIAYATLNLTFFERIPFENKFTQQFKNGFRNGWENLIRFFIAMVNIWPFLLIGFALFWAIKRYRAKHIKSLYKNKKEK